MRATGSSILLVGMLVGNLGSGFMSDRYVSNNLVTTLSLFVILCKIDAVCIFRLVHSVSSYIHTMRIVYR